MRGIICSRPVSARTVFPAMLLVSVVLLVLAGAQPCRAADTDQAKVMHKAAVAYIDAAKILIGRGRYVEASDQLAKASDGARYLTESELKTYNDLLGQVRAKTGGRDAAMKQLESGKSLLADKKFAQAKAQFDAAAQSEFLTPAEKTQAQTLSKQADAGARMQAEAMKTLYQDSVAQYEAGQYDKAREGFMQVAASGVVAAPAGKTPEYYLQQIAAKTKDAQPAAAVAEAPKNAVVVAEPNPLDLTAPKATEPTAAAPAAPEAPVVASPAAQAVQASPVAAPAATETPAAPAASGTYMDEVMQQRRRVQSYVDTMVEAAVQNANKAVASGQFDQARSEISLAMQTVEDRKSVLGADSYTKYMDQLAAMNKQVAQDEVAANKLRDQQAAAEAESSKKAIRTQQESERQKKIREYLDTAATLQEEARYEQAIGALEQVLAIDPLNQAAKVQKSMLEKLIIYREYRGAMSKQNREIQNLTVEVARSATPYVDEITYPKDWKELDKRRKTGKTGEPVMTPEDVEVYKQLDTVVDLSQLTPETTLSEAFDMMAKSVQPSLPLFVNWGDLRNNSLNQQSAINMQGLPKVKLSQGFDMLLSAAGGGFVELGYMVNNGLVVVSTKTALPKNLITHVYQVGDILGSPSSYTASAASTGSSSSGSTSGSTTSGSTSSGSSSSGSSSSGSSSSGSSSSGSSSSGSSSSGSNNSSSSSSGSGSSGGGGFSNTLDLQITSDDLINAIINGTELTSWSDNGGDGTIRILGGNRLVVYQTPKIQSDVVRILDDLRQHLGEQVAIESRFLLVDEQYIEDIGLDVDFRFNNPGSKWGPIEVQQNSATATQQQGVGVNTAMTATGSYGTILDDFQVKFLLNATQQNTSTLTFTAPKVTVLSNEMAGIGVYTNQAYTDGYATTQGVATQGVVQNGTIVATSATAQKGVSLNIIPTISQDRKYVLLNVDTSLQDYSLSPGTVSVSAGGILQQAPVSFPLWENTNIQTRVYVPDKGTLLIGGQKVKVHNEIESGVPVLSKVPYLGRLFENRSKNDQTKVLLILVKPTIIFTSEAEADHVAALGDAAPLATR